MTAPSPLLAAATEQLAAALCGSAQVCTHSGPTRWCERTADALLASGAVVPAASLADDEALTGVWPDTFGEWTAGQADAARAMKQAVLRALAAALEDR